MHLKVEDDVIDEYDWGVNEWRPIFYLHGPQEALSNKWTPNIDCHKIEIMSITAVEIWNFCAGFIIRLFIDYQICEYVTLFEFLIYIS